MDFTSSDFRSKEPMIREWILTHPSTRAGGVKCDDPNELGESLEVDLAYQTCWIFWIARGDTCLEAVHMR